MRIAQFAFSTFFNHIEKCNKLESSFFSFSVTVKLLQKGKEERNSSPDPVPFLHHYGGVYTSVAYYVYVN